MLIFENSPVLKSAELKRLERRLRRLDRAEKATAALGTAGIFAGLSTALFNGLVPFVGSMFGVMDTWGRPDFVPEQLLLAVVSFGAMVVIGGPLIGASDRLENQRKELEALEAGQELEEPEPEPDEFIEYRTGRKQKWESWNEYSYHYHLSCKHYQ